MASAVPPPPPYDRVRYKRNDNFAFCRHCLTHLALLGGAECENMVFFGHNWFLFKDAVNLRLDEEHEITNGATNVRATYCRNCGADMGLKMSLMVQDDIVKEGTHLLNGSDYRSCKCVEGTGIICEMCVETIMPDSGKIDKLSRNSFNAHSRGWLSCII